MQKQILPKNDNEKKKTLWPVHGPEDGLCVRKLKVHEQVVEQVCKWM